MSIPTLDDILNDIFDLQRKTTDLETVHATLRDMHSGLESDVAQLTRRVLEMERRMAPDYQAGEHAKNDLLRKLEIEEPHATPRVSKKRHA